jgi:hypothetical protein
VAPTEQKIACYANNGGNADADSCYLIRSHVTVVLGFIVPVMILSLCAVGRQSHGQAGQHQEFFQG